MTKMTQLINLFSNVLAESDMTAEELAKHLVANVSDHVEVPVTSSHLKDIISRNAQNSKAHEFDAASSYLGHELTDTLSCLGLEIMAGIDDPVRAQEMNKFMKHLGLV